MGPVCCWRRDGAIGPDSTQSGPPPVRDVTDVDELRNEIREAVGRYERPVSTAFTKEALAAICEAVGYVIDTDRLSSMPQMRAGILWKIGAQEDDDPADAEQPFRKGELEAVATALCDD